VEAEAVFVGGGSIDASTVVVVVVMSAVFAEKVESSAM